MFRRRERGVISHAITFLDDVATCTPSLDAWDQFVWLPGAAMLQAATEVEQYSYHCGHAIDLGPIMLATHLCAVRALVFEGSILAYNPARDKAKWVPTHGIANDLSWAEERLAVALANFVPCTPQEVAHIARLGAQCLVSWPDDSSSEEEDDGQVEEEDNEMGRWRKRMTMMGRQRKRKVNGKRRTPQMWKNRGKQTPNRHPAAQGLSKERWSERPNHRDNDDHGSGGL